MQVDTVYHGAFQVEEAWSIPRHHTYENSLCEFMVFAHHHNFPRYPKNTIFTRQQLLEIKPLHVLNYLAKKAFVKSD